MSWSDSNKVSKLLKILGLIAIIGVLVAVARQVLKGIRSADADPDDEHAGV
jgi:hypothetical protein